MKRRIFRNAVYSLFAVAFFFTVLANTVPDFVIAEYCEIIAFAAVGATVWEIFRQLKDNEYSDGGIKIKPLWKY